MRTVLFLFSLFGILLSVYSKNKPNYQTVSIFYGITEQTEPIGQGREINLYSSIFMVPKGVLGIGAHKYIKLNRSFSLGGGISYYYRSLGFKIGRRSQAGSNFELKYDAKDVFYLRQHMVHIDQSIRFEMNKIFKFDIGLFENISLYNTYTNPILASEALSPFNSGSDRRVKNFELGINVKPLFRLKKIEIGIPINIGITKVLYDWQNPMFVKTRTLGLSLAWILK